MKKAILFVLLFLGCVVHSFAYTYGTFTPWNNPSPTTTVYIAPRTDGMTGSGTSSDPYNANTSAKFDTLIQTYNNPSGNATVIYFAAGTYTTMGYQFTTSRTAYPNVYLVGAGIGSTIVQLDTSASEGTNTSIQIFGCRYDQTANGFELWNMTVDGNANNNTMFTGGTGLIELVLVQGNDILIKNCEFKGWGTKVAGDECFPVLIQPSVVAFNGSSFSHAHVDGCTFDSPATGNADGTSICVVNADNTITITDYEILNNTFTNVSSDFSYSHAMCGVFMQGNTVNGCDGGFYCEPGSGSGAGVNATFPITIDSNTFENVQFAIAFDFHASGVMGGVTVTNNAFILINSSTEFSAGLNIQGATPTTNPAMPYIYVNNNSFVGLGQGLTDTGYWRAVYFKGDTAEVVGNVTILNNTVGTNYNSGQEFQLDAATAPTLQYCANFYQNGSAVALATGYTGTLTACSPFPPGTLSTVGFSTPPTPGTLSTAIQ